MPEVHAQLDGMEILQWDTLPPARICWPAETPPGDGYEGLGRQRNPGAREGMGNFVYLADARFLPRGETHLHSHREIDVISVMV